MNKIRKGIIERNYIKLLATGTLFLFPLLQAYSMLRTLGLRSLYFPLFIYFILISSIINKGVLLLAKKDRKVTFSLLIIWGIFIHVAITIIISGVKFGFDAMYRDQYLATLQTGLIYAFLCFLIGMNFDLVMNQLIYNKYLRRFAIVSVVLLLSVLGYSIVQNYFLNGIFQIKYSIDYLAISDGIAITLLVVFSLTKKASLRLVLLPVFIIIMMGTISRGSMLAFIGAIICFKIISIKMKPTKVLSLVLMVFLLMFIISYLSGNPLFLYHLFGESRGVNIIAGVLTDRNAFLQSDPSMIARQEMLYMGISDLKNTWFFGGFMRGAETGIGYIHNWLSFWSNYGIVPFVMFFIMYIVSLIKCISYYRNQSNITLNIIILVSFYTLIQILFFRAYVYATVWFSLAALVNIPTKIEKENSYYQMEKIK